MTPLGSVTEPISHTLPGAPASTACPWLAARRKQVLPAPGPPATRTVTTEARSPVALVSLSTLITARTRVSRLYAALA